jgi:hypothetical protein
LQQKNFFRYPEIFAAKKFKINTQKFDQKTKQQESVGTRKSGKEKTRAATGKNGQKVCFSFFLI